MIISFLEHNFHDEIFKEIKMSFSEFLCIEKQFQMDKYTPFV